MKISPDESAHRDHRRLTVRRGGSSRRSFLFVSTVMTFGLMVGPAYGGSYLNRAALLLKHAGKEISYLRARVYDRELARVVHELAAARLEAASGMQVPKEVVQAHPHLLLTLENFERAAAAAREGNAERFLVYEQRARDEERTFHSVLKQLGWSVPEV